MAYPQVNITDEKINKALIELGNSSLPNLMVLTPVRMVGDLDKKMNVYDLKECKKASNAIFEKNFVIYQMIILKNSVINMHHL